MAAAYCYEGMSQRFLALLIDIQMRYLLYMRHLWAECVISTLIACLHGEH